MEQKYKAFISYRHVPRDMAAAKLLHGLIEQFNIPKALRRYGKRRFGRVFRDREEFAASSDLSENICRALDNSEYLVVVCSPAAAQSPWVAREIEYFLRHHDRSCVLAVLISGEPAEAFPKPLTQARKADGSITQLEPLAVDARADSIPAMRRRLRREALRLYSAMLGCSYDELARRSQRRSRRRAGAAVAAVLAVALGFSGLMMVKNHQIDQKNQELEAKNEELRTQKAEILLRESELLTQNGEKAMERGAYSTAMSYAIDALNGERPYYAAAEALLMEALDLFGVRNEDYFIVETEIEQPSAIGDFLFSADGERIVTYDDFGTLNCFDSKSGEMLWSAVIPADGADSYDQKWPVISCENYGSVIALYEDRLAAFDVSSGEQLWQREGIRIEDGHLRLAPDGESLICLVHELNAGDGTVSQYLVSLSAESGEVLTVLDVGEAQPINYYISDAEEGAFSLDGRYYAFSRCVYVDDVSTLSYFVADLQNKTAREAFSESLPGSAYDGTVEKLSFTRDGAALIVARLSPDGALNAAVEKIDIESGEKLWRTVPETEAGETVLCSALDDIDTIHTASKTYLSRGNALYCVDNASGSAEWYTLFPAKLSSLSIVQDSFFAYVLQDGSYALAWKNDAGLHSSEIYSAAVSLGENTGAKLWDEGFILGEIVDGKIEDISVAGTGARGRVAVQSADSERRLYVLRSCEKPGLSAGRSTGLDEYGRLYGPNAALFDTELVLGPFIRDGSQSRYLSVFDSRSLELKREIATEHLTDMGDMPYIGSEAAYVQDDGFGGIVLCGADGSRKVLSESSNILLYDSEIVSFTACEYLSRTAVQSSDGDVLSARCGKGELYLWENGEFSASMALPEGMIWALSDNTVFHRMFELGGNGLVVASRFDNSDDLLMDGFAVYDRASGEWTFLADEGGGEADRLCCVGDVSPVFAVAEYDGTLWIYRSTEAGFETESFPLSMPLSSVRQLSFILDDSVIMANTADAQLVFYDAASGDVLLRQQLAGTNLGNFRACADADNDRLYVYDSAYSFGVNGYLIDLGSWTVLSELEGALCYDAEKNELYRIVGESLEISTVPTTAEMLETARQILG